MSLADALRAYALTLPEAAEDFPWDELVIKVRGKIFLFLGRGGDPVGFAVKLPQSAHDALSLPFAKPTGYGLGRAGWVSVTLPGPDAVPREQIEAWIRESYRAVAPKRLAAQLTSPA